MAINFLNNINLNKNQLEQARIENLGTDPASGVSGQIYYNSADNVLKIYNSTQWVEVGGGVTSFTATDGTFISLTPNTTQGGAATLTADLSATGTPNNTVYLRGDNTWSPVAAIPGTYTWSIQGGTGGPTTVASGTNITFAGGTNVTTALVGNTLTINSTNASITLTGEVTGTGTTSISTTVADGVLDVANFNAAAIVTAAEGIETNNNDTTLPTSAAVKAYVDAAVVGGLVYQGGYNADTNIPDLTTSPNSILKGWTYTVTDDGTFFGEQLRVGDVLIAEVDSPTTLADWTTVQNNIDLASLTQIGIGNVNAGTGINVSYLNGTATVSTATTSATGTITAGSLSGTVNHTFGINTIVQTIDATGATVFCDVTRTATTVVATVAAVQASNITILVQKIG
jgi:hypothetical protein